MKRDPTKLAERAFDLLVIGAGINGACVARDAAMRGLAVAVIDRGDFVSSTSFNSLRIVHGGLRYLQHLDFGRMRQSIRERSCWLRIAPGLVRCLPFMAPTIGRGMRSRAAFRAALRINDWVGFDRNRGLEGDRRIPSGRVISRAEALERYPGRDADRITGGALWYDAQMISSERLVVEVMRSAVDAGAVAVNYVAVESLVVAADRVTGARVRDVLSGEAFEIGTRVVVNAAGPAVDSLVREAAGIRRPNPVVRLSKAMNILTRRIAGETAVGVPGRHCDPNAKIKHGARLLFVTPWRDLSLVGTTHAAYEGRPAEFRVSETDVAEFVDEINYAVPAARLTLHDVRFVYAGLLPMADPKPGDADVRLLLHHRVIDHRRQDAVGGLISLVGVKFTTARLAAEQVVDLAFAMLGRPSPPCRTADAPLTCCDEVKFYDGRGGRWDDSGTLKEEVRRAVGDEMAVKLSDVVFRRTDAGSRGHPGGEVLGGMGLAMAAELGWDAQRVDRELAEVEAVFGHWKGDSGYRIDSAERSKSERSRPVSQS